jgi:hypothetical protein
MTKRGEWRSRLAFRGVVVSLSDSDLGSKRNSVAPGCVPKLSPTRVRTATGPLMRVLSAAFEVRSAA